MLGISERTLWQLSAPRGPIPLIRVGRSIRYDLDDVKAALSEMKSRPKR